SPFLSITLRPPPPPTLFPYTTLFRSASTPPSWPSASRTALTYRCQPSRWLRSTYGSPPTPDTISSRWPGAAATVTRRSMANGRRSEEHTSELQSRENLVCRLLLEKKK